MNEYPIEIPDKVKEFWSKDHGHRVSEGMFQKVREGAFPGCAPVGYLNVRDMDGTAGIIIDPVKGPLVQEAFRLAAEGKLSLRKILWIVTEGGLVSRNEKPMGISAFCHLLRNPFYTGRIAYQGGVAQGNHEALVKEDVFLRVVEMLKEKRGLLRFQ